jgi:hypothetical protein
MGVADHLSDSTYRERSGIRFVNSAALAIKPLVPWAVAKVERFMPITATAEALVPAVNLRIVSHLLNHEPVQYASGLLASFDSCGVIIVEQDNFFHSEAS